MIDNNDDNSVVAKWLSIKEFVDSGLLQEVNRQFFHPMGLALEVEQNSLGEGRISGIWDYRDDPEGIIFDDSIHCEDAIRKKNYVRDLLISKAKNRINNLGFIQQPIIESYIIKEKED